MTYRAPVADIAFTLKHPAGFGAALAEGLYGDLDEDLVNSVLEEAGRFATEVIAPLNRVGDRQGARIKDGVVTTADGWKEAYRDWSAAGWNGISGPTDWGGGFATRHQFRLHRDVELGRDGLRHGVVPTMGRSTRRRPMALIISRKHICRRS
jgi:alkylation response protein AidB-like acyl-CoA dehydrogenase